MFNVSWMFVFDIDILAFSNFGGSLDEGKIGSSSISVLPVPLILTSFTTIFRLGIVKPNSVSYLDSNLIKISIFHHY